VSHWKVVLLSYFQSSVLHGTAILAQTFTSSSAYIYFQSTGVKRRVLQGLAGMGICETYHTINKLNESIAANGLNHLATAGSRPDAIIVYDNDIN